MKSHPKIGFIGMGLMGVPMTLRLHHAGYDVGIWNRTVRDIDAFDGLDILRFPSITSLVTSVDIIMLCVSDTEAVHQILYADNGLLDSLSDSQLVIDFSSIDPAATRQFASAVEQKGGYWVDAPVSGGVAGAEQGTLAIMAGGDERVIHDLSEVLAPLSQRVTRMGPNGAGQITKIGNQMLVSCNLMVMAEVIALAEKAGVDSTQIPVALAGGFADSLPLQLTGSRMADRQFEPVKWHVKTLLKDLQLAKKLAAENDAESPMAALANELMKQHNDVGFSESDPATLINLYAANSSFNSSSNAPSSGAEKISNVDDATN